MKIRLWLTWLTTWVEAYKESHFWSFFLSPRGVTISRISDLLRSRNDSPLILLVAKFSNVSSRRSFRNCCSSSTVNFRNSCLLSISAAIAWNKFWHVQKVHWHAHARVGRAGRGRGGATTLTCVSSRYGPTWWVCFLCVTPSFSSVSKLRKRSAKAHRLTMYVRSSLDHERRHN